MIRHLSFTNHKIATLRVALMTAVAFLFTVTNGGAVTWQTVVNNKVPAPLSKSQGQGQGQGRGQPNKATKAPYFFSDNQPAVNEAGQVVFRARAKPLTGESSGGSGGGGEPVRGVYVRTPPFGSIEVQTAKDNPIVTIADNVGVKVPQPNTTAATFIEFPSTPRADALSAMVATRGQSTPVVINPVDGTRVGTSGVYATQLKNKKTELVTAASQVANVQTAPGAYLYPYFGVPGETVGTKFDQFPGSPSPVATSIVAFKGNYTTDASRTGVFYRDLRVSTQPVAAVVKSGVDTIPGTDTSFGSAAPPSASVDSSNGNVRTKIVFAGFDNEESPSAGGIYVYQVSPPTQTGIVPVVSIGDPVPGIVDAKFTKFSEGLSFNGRLVSFWASWGAETKTVYKTCPTDGNKDLIAYCKQNAPLPDYTYQLTVPVNQGIFVADTTTRQVQLVARTGTADGFTDFIYWTYSGRPPGGEEAEDAEPPRWRASAFTAMTSQSIKAMVFKGLTGATTDGLYLKLDGVNGLKTVLQTGMSGASVDPEAPVSADASDPLVVTTIGVERDGFRGPWLTVTVGMANKAATVSWAGIYAHDCGSGCTTW